jgi:hypothetical protein
MANGDLDTLYKNRKASLWVEDSLPPTPTASITSASGCSPEGALTVDSPHERCPRTRARWSADRR